MESFSRKSYIYILAVYGAKEENHGAVFQACELKDSKLLVFLSDDKG